MSWIALSCLEMPRSRGGISGEGSRVRLRHSPRFALQEAEHLGSLPALVNARLSVSILIAIASGCSGSFPLKLVVKAANECVFSKLEML